MVAGPIFEGTHVLREGARRAGVLGVALLLGAGTLTACTSKDDSADAPAPTSEGSATSPSGVGPSPGESASAGPSDEAATADPDPNDADGADGGAGTAGEGDDAGDPTGEKPPADPPRNDVPDPAMEGPYEPVDRPGAPARAPVSADPAPFDGPITWDDGLQLEVADVTQGEVAGRGPGVFVGEPRTTFDLVMTNDSSRPVLLDGVVVTTVYGPDRRLARPVYDNRTEDFVGSVPAGGSAKARYVFSIPTPDLDDVTVYVDFDGRHSVAQFRGTPREVG